MMIFLFIRLIMQGDILYAAELVGEIFFYSVTYLKPGKFIFKEWGRASANKPLSGPSEGYVMSNCSQDNDWGHICLFFPSFYGVHSECPPLHYLYIAL